jgi:hypothetical protein
MKPRDLAFDRLPAHQQAAITFSSPLTSEEEPIVVTATGDWKTLQLQVDPSRTKATVTNPTSTEVTYFFAIVNRKLLAILNADWRALAAFIRSLQTNLLH